MKFPLWHRTILLFGATGSLGFGFVAPPALNPAEGDSFATFPLTITGTAGTEIHYTLNGTEPTKSDPVIASGGTITINREWTVKAKAWLAAEASATTTGNFTMTGDIAAGGSHSLALKSLGGVWAWGLESNGRLGNNSNGTGNISSPVASRYSGGVIGDGSMLAAGGTHSVFLKNGGTVWSFGLNTTGQLGDNSTTTRITAVQVKKSTGATDWLTGCVGVAAGGGFSAALSSAGEVYAWGDKTSGRLGDGTTTGTRLYAGKVYQGTSGTTPLAGINRIAAATAFALAKEPSTKEAQVTKNGYAWAWGVNTNGQLGQGNTTTLAWAAKLKINSGTFVTDALDVACGESHTAVVRWKDSDPNMLGRVFCCGQQQYGRLGNLPSSTTLAVVNTAANVSYLATQVIKGDGTALTGISSVAAGSAHTLALDVNGKVWAWGYNVNGALGDNGSTNRGYASLVKNPTNTGDLTNIVRIAAGGTGTASYSMAIAADGTVYAWGDNTNGRLGNGGTSLSRLPVAVTGGFDLLPTLPDATLACSVSPGSYPNSVVLSVAPSAASSTISKVDFMVGTSLAAQITSAPWTTTLSNMGNGNYHVYAIATDTATLLDHTLSADFTISSDPGAASMDSDGDGLIDSTETTLGTSATDADTDGDGIPDGIDTAPLIPDTVPMSTAATVMVWSPLE